jgi:hypothetical protein
MERPYLSRTTESVRISHFPHGRVNTLTYPPEEDGVPRTCSVRVEKV